jgi:GH25 family lysozyme M1 (1,4-beta-N-acetylmuramidase)
MSARTIALGSALALGTLAVSVPGLPGQNPNNPKGIDVYNGDGTINWASVKASGVSFAFIKATEGIGFQDANYPTNRTQAKAQGITVGAYHFARPGNSPSATARGVAEADYFINYAKPQKGEFQLVMDFEDNSNALSQADMWAWFQAFCGEVKAKTHELPIIYCGQSFWNTNMPTTATNLGCPLWVANWGVSSPHLPRAWTTYSFWQYSSTGTTPGVSGNCDLDTYNGSSSAMSGFTYPRDPLNRR